MTTYTSTVATTLSIPANRARLVVGYLRSEYRTLDALSRQQICADYSEWIAATIDADPAMADRLAASYGA